MTFLETAHLVKYCSFSHSCRTAKMEDNLGKSIILREEIVRINHFRLQCLYQWPQSSQNRKTLQVNYDSVHFSCNSKYLTHEGNITAAFDQKMASKDVPLCCCHQPDFSVHIIACTLLFFVHFISFHPSNQSNCQLAHWENSLKAGEPE